jgi:Arc/MetJ-type ribon-helix-helix transcriptional regulator
MGGSAAMNIVLSPATQKLLEDRMRKDGYATPDDAVRGMLETLEQNEAAAQFGAGYLDEETLAAIDRAEEQIARGEHQDWEEVKAELRAKRRGK